MTPSNTTPASPTAALQSLYNLDFRTLGLEQAIEMQSASLAALVSVSSYAIDLSRSAGLFSPMAFSALPGDFLDTATKAYASFLDLQMCWLALLRPQAAHADAVSHGKLPARALPLEEGMDAAFGARAGSKS